MNPNDPNNYPVKLFSLRPAAFTCFLILFCLVVIWFFVLRSPSDFPGKVRLAIEKGDSVSRIANKLEAAKVIRSSFSFRAAALIFQEQRSLNAGEYIFDKPISVFQVLGRISRGERGFNYVKITFPEGLMVSEMAALAKKHLPRFDSKAFLRLAKDQEGYLFPDTYHFLDDTTTEQVITIMKENFERKIASVQPRISAFRKPLADVVKMGSILEGEARTMETRRIVAGILWKRLSIGMPLQVDTSFRYINGKTTATLNLEDLQIDSPYNSYKYKGLPPTPISNPGLDALIAAVTPINTRYLYFLTDAEGMMHYARTFDEHLANKAQFLK